MIVQRWMFNVKQGRMEEAVAVILVEIEKSCPPNTRVFTSHIGHRDVLDVDFEFESLAELEKFWAEWQARPETPAFGGKWDDLTERGATNETWHLEE